MVDMEVENDVPRSRDDVVEKTKSGWIKKTVFCVIGLCCCILLGAGIGVLLKTVISAPDEHVYFSEEKWDEELEKCMYAANMEETRCMDFQFYLEDIVSNSGDEDLKTKAIVFLSSMYESASNTKDAIDILEHGVSAVSNDKNKYKIYNSLLSIYLNEGNIDKYTDILRAMVELPDSMILEFEDWTKIKPMLKIELSNLENRDNGNEDEENYQE